MCGKCASSPVKKMSRFSYKPRGFSNKGALLTIVWSFSFFLMISYIDQVINSSIVYVFSASVMIYPIAGWLADVYFGRYKVICWSMRLLWISMIAYAAALLMKDYKLWSNDTFLVYVQVSAAAMGCLGLGGFLANILQFGIDQLIDASSWDISSYISWHVWIFFLSACLIQLSQVCRCGAYNETVAFLAVPVLFMTMSVVSDMLFNHLLVKEPVSHNPLKLVVQVLKYAWKNKYPRLRSAFTYWDDKPFSRIDLGKTKFGGPFTTEQVEDVKTFFRFLAVIPIISASVGLFYLLKNTFRYLMFQFEDKHFVDDCSVSTFMGNCYKRNTVQSMDVTILTISVPIIEFLLYPFLWRVSIMAKIGLKQKFLLGIFFLLLYEICLLSLQVVGGLRSQDYRNITCFVFANAETLKDNNVLNLDYKWLGIAGLFSGFSMYLLLTSAVEFVCAQAPYSMKGLFAGAMYCMIGLSFALSYGGSVGLSAIAKTEAMKHVILGCGVWYFLSVVVVTIVVILMACVIVKWYSFRRRDENIHNEQIFAVNYFEKYCTRAETP